MIVWWIGVAVTIALCLLNWVLLVGRFIRPRVPSWVPIVPGAVLGFLLAFAPLERVRWMWWLAAFIDGGSLPGILTSLVFWKLDGRRRKPVPNDPRSAARAREDDESGEKK